MGPPEKIELPVDRDLQVMSLEEINHLLRNTRRVDTHDIINSLCAHVNEYQDAAYMAWESAMGEDL